MEVAPVVEAISSIADTAAASTTSEAASPAVSSSASIPSSSTSVDNSVPAVNTAMPSAKDLNEITSAPPSHVDANTIVTQNIPKTDNSVFSPTTIDRTAPSNFNTTTFDMRSPSVNQGSNTRSVDLMSGIKSYFNQPIQNRSNYPNFSNTVNKTSDSLSKLSNAMFLGPRLSINPTMNFNSRQQQTTSSNGVGSQKSF